MDDFSPGSRPYRQLLDGPAGGLYVFVLALGLMIFVAAPIQYALGTWGLVVTELMLLGLAVLAAGPGERRKLAFPIRLPEGRQVVGTLILWAGYLGLALSAAMATAYFFPEEVYGTSYDIGRVIGSFPLGLALVVSALLPAICEEFLFRGYIQHSLREIKSKWATIILVATMFAVMHLSLYRLLPTFVLGIGLCYLRQRSGNMTLPMLMHLVNNSFSVLAGYVAAGEAAAAPTVETLAYIPAMTCFYALASPLAILIGTSLLSPPRQLGQRGGLLRGKGKQIAVAAVLTALLLAGFIAGLTGLPEVVNFPAALPSGLFRLF